MPATPDKVYSEQIKIDTLHHMFTDVKFTFHESVEEIAQGMKYGARGLDEDEVIYQFKSVILNELIASELIDPTRAQKKIYFDEMKFQFDLVKEKEQTRLRLTIRYNPKHNVSNFFTGLAVDINKEAPKILEAALKRLYRTMFSPEALKVAESVTTSTQRKKEPGKHVIQGSYEIAASKDTITKHILDPKNCHLIHPRLKYDATKGCVTQDLVISHVEHDIVREGNRIIFRSKTGAATFDHVNLIFELTPNKNGKTLCQMSVEYNYRGWNLGNYVADKTVDDKVAFRFTKLIVTSLRHITMDTTPTPTMAFEEKPVAVFN